MDYQIIAATPELGQITVRYLDAHGAALADYAIDLPVVEGAYPTGAALEAEIQGRAPTWLLDRRAVIAVADFSAIAALVPRSDEPLPTPAPAPIPQSLAQAIVAAEDSIDTKAGAVRKRFVTVTPCQSTIYEIKARQAHAYKNAGYTGAVPPYIAASAAALGRTAQDIADEIIVLEDLWTNQVDPLIEAARLAGKQSVNGAATVAEVDTLRAAAIAALDYFAPAATLPPPLL